MSDTVSFKKLELVGTLKEGITIGAKNIGPILVNVLLWVLTVWIPYLNVGTTIGLMTGIVSKASKGEAISFTEIFNPAYRKYMGEFFLASGLVGLGVSVGIVFGIIPGIVISIAWSLTLLLVIDKGKNPAEAITLSNNCTYGHKGKMFCIYFVACLAFFIVQLVLVLIARAIHNSIITYCISFIMVLTMFFEIFVFIGLQASVYKQLAACE